MDRGTEDWTEARKNGRRDGRMDERTEEQKDTYVFGQSQRDLGISNEVNVRILADKRLARRINTERESQTNRQTDIHQNT